MTSLQRTISALIKASSASAVLPPAAMPSSAIRCCTWGSLNAFMTSAVRRWMTSRGVALGAVRPNHVRSEERRVGKERRSAYWTDNCHNHMSQKYSSYHKDKYL